MLLCVRVCVGECESFAFSACAVSRVEPKGRKTHKNTRNPLRKKRNQKEHPKQTSAAAMEKRIELERRARKVNQVS